MQPAGSAAALAGYMMSPPRVRILTPWMHWQLTPHTRRQLERLKLILHPGSPEAAGPTMKSESLAHWQTP
jgi:hypothetical protein